MNHYFIRPILSSKHYINVFFLQNQTVKLFPKIFITPLPILQKFDFILKFWFIQNFYSSYKVATITI